MREILFRGKRIDNGEWIEGFLIGRYGPYKKRNIIKTSFIDNGTCFFKPIEVDKDTLGQFTGLYDKNKIRIFEGDIATDGTDIVEIAWDEAYAWACNMVKGEAQLIYPLWIWDECEDNDYRQLEIIGNIFDNPDLLDGSK